MEGLIEIVCPVQANSARPTSIQSVVPSMCTVVIEVLDAFVDIIAVKGVVDVTLWYKNGIFKTARRKGSNTERDDTA